MMMAAIAGWSGCGESDSADPQAYLSQEPPGDSAVVFAPGIVSTDRNEHFGPTFTPDGRMIVWSVTSMTKTLRMVERTDTGWSEPRELLFNEAYREDGPYFSPDGSRLYYSSMRPRESDPTPDDWDIWYVERSDSGWSAPQHLPAPVNTTEASQLFHAVAANGNIYFRTLGPERTMYRSSYIGGVYREPEPLPEAINTDLFYSSPYIASDESYMIFSSTRPGGLGSADLYITFRVNDGWSEPANLGPGVNSELDELSPHLSPDGRFLFFGRQQVRSESSNYHSGDIYWVRADVIDSLKGDH